MYLGGLGSSTCTVKSNNKILSKKFHRLNFFKKTVSLRQFQLLFSLDESDEAVVRKKPIEIVIYI